MVEEFIGSVRSNLNNLTTQETDLLLKGESMMKEALAFKKENSSLDKESIEKRMQEKFPELYQKELEERFQSIIKRVLKDPFDKLVEKLSDKKRVGSKKEKILNNVMGIALEWLIKVCQQKLAQK